MLAFHAFLALACCALVTLPLVGLPGYEFSAALALMYGVVGTFYAAFRPGGGFEKLALGPSEASIVIRQTVTFWATMAPGVALAMVSAAPCDPLAAIAFVPLLAMVSAFVASAAGTFISTLATRWWVRLLTVGAMLCISAATTLWPLGFGPQVFAFDHFAGYVPGPLYDEHLSITSALLWFRLGSFALGVVFTGLAMRRARVWGPALMLFIALEVSGTNLGFRMTDAVLAERLGGLRETTHFILHYPRNEKATEIDQFVADLEFRHTQISHFLGPLRRAASPSGSTRTLMKSSVWSAPIAHNFQNRGGAKCISTTPNFPTRWSSMN